MLESAPARFEWGQAVAAALDLFNDGSFPDEAQGALLVAQGKIGEVVRVGQYVPTRQTVYLVDFGSGRVVGCCEDEIVVANAPGDPRVCSREGK